MKRYLLLILVGGWLLAPTVGWTQTAEIQKKVDDTLKQEKAKTASLEKLLAESLKNNPDIRVAEAKARVGAAELDRVRLKVASEVAILHAEIEVAEAGVAEAQERYERAYQLYFGNRRTISKEELGAAKLTLLKLKSELASLQAKLPPLLGRSAGSIDFTSEKLFDVRKAALETAQAQLKRQMDEEFARFWAARKLADQADTPLREKLRKALDAPVQLDATNLPAKEAVAVVANKLPVVNVVIRVKNFNKKGLDLKLKEPVPVGAALQYIEDELGIVFILRDYGIVVVGADELMPPGAIRVVDFWKHGKAAETKDKTRPAVVPPAKPGEPRGKIERVDPKDPYLVQISNGSDAGLAKGQTLDVFRSQPEPKYVGRIEVLEVTARHAVARMNISWQNPLAMPREGDLVTTTGDGKK